MNGPRRVGFLTHSRGFLTLLLVSMSSCGGSELPTETVDPPVILQPADLCSDNPASAIATFADANLEVAVRTALVIVAQDDLTCGLLATLTNLTAYNAGIVSMVGVQNLISLTRLILNDNQLTGAIPPELGNLSSLEWLRLVSNQLTGAIPAELGNLSSLQTLRLHGNQLTGAIPLEVAQLGGLIQNTYGSDRCDFLPGNTGLFIPDADGFRAADLDADGFICNVVVPPGQ